jgi:YqaJ-like viral recombinase domain
MQLARLEICDAEQQTPQWFEFRRGTPSASKFQCLLAKSADKKGRRTYLYDLAGEIITERVTEGYTNDHMERGNIDETEARDWYAFTTGAKLERVGCIKSAFLGACVSPDSLIGKEGGLEIKTRLPRLQMELVEDGQLPNEHKAQIQGAMWILGRPWWDFLSYSKGMKPFRLRVLRDDAYIAALAVEVKQFNADLKALVERHK